MAVSEHLLDRPLVPVATPDDAAETYEQLRPYLLDSGTVPLVVHVVEKADGAPDKAGLEQSRELAQEAFDRFRALADTDGLAVETEILYGTDVAATVHDAAEEHDASAVVFRSRGANRWLELLSGNVRANLVADSDCPVVVLP
jgi:nucleotide-binding universal stress UspA family protein